MDFYAAAFNVFFWIFLVALPMMIVVLIHEWNLPLKRNIYLFSIASCAVLVPVLAIAKRVTSDSWPNFNGWEVLAGFVVTFTIITFGIHENQQVISLAAVLSGIVTYLLLNSLF